MKLKKNMPLSPTQALEEIREIWAGAECGQPVYAQEAYAIRLCKQMYQIAVDAIRCDRDLRTQAKAALGCVREVVIAGERPR